MIAVAAPNALDPRHQLDLRIRPKRRPAMHHVWRDLLFLHFPVEPDLIRPLIPSGLDVDVFPDRSGREMAWVGIVLFSIDRITFGKRLKIPTAYRFLETNVRTYVHRSGSDPAVLFLSLDAQSLLTCLGARITFGLPYRHAEMDLEANGPLRTFLGDRSNAGASYRVQAEIGEPMGEAEPGTLEFFLAERYLLYSVRFGRLVGGRVHHEPYLLHTARCTLCEQSLTSALGIPPQPIAHAMYVPRVVSEVFAPQAVAARRGLRHGSR